MTATHAGRGIVESAESQPRGSGRGGDAVRANLVRQDFLAFHTVIYPGPVSSMADAIGWRDVMLVGIVGARPRLQYCSIHAQDSSTAGQARTQIRQRLA